MSILKRRLTAAFLVVGVASLVTFLQVEANHETDDQIGEEAVWNAAGDDLNEIARACDNSAAYNQCFIEQMGGYASTDAVAFSQLLAAQKAPRAGYLAGMREAGLVDLGYVVYPGGTKSSHGWVLMNGFPSLVNVDDFAMLPQADSKRTRCSQHCAETTRKCNLLLPAASAARTRHRKSNQSPAVGKGSLCPTLSMTAATIVLPWPRPALALISTLPANSWE